MYTEATVLHDIGFLLRCVILGRVLVYRHFNYNILNPILSFEMLKAPVLHLHIHYMYIKLLQPVVKVEPHSVPAPSPLASPL